MLTNFMRQLIVLSALSFVAVSCTKPPQELFGTWVEEKPAAKKTDDFLSQISSDLAPTATINVRADNKFELTLPEAHTDPKGRPDAPTEIEIVGGSWNLKGDGVSFAVEKVGGRPLDEVMKKMGGPPQTDSLVLPTTATLSSDKKTLTLNFKGGSQKSMTMTMPESNSPFAKHDPNSAKR